MNCQVDPRAAHLGQTSYVAVLSFRDGIAHDVAKTSFLMYGEDELIHWIVEVQ